MAAVSDKIRDLANGLSDNTVKEKLIAIANEVASLQQLSPTSDKVGVLIDETLDEIEHNELAKAAKEDEKEGYADDATLAKEFLATEPLPDGVNFDDLISEGCTPAQAEAAYTKAIEEAGGAEAVAKHTPAMDKLCAEVAARKHLVTQLRGWQSYNLTSFLKSVTEGEIRIYGENQIKAFEADLNKLGVHCEVAIPKAKSLRRATDKAAIKYAGDITRLVDVNRCTVNLKTSSDLFAAVRAACKRWVTDAAMIVELEDHYFARTMAGGYRHVQMLVRLAGSIWEIQFNTAPILHVKHRLGHRVYKTTRYIQESLLLFAMRHQLRKLRAILAIEGVRPIARPDQISDKNGLRAVHHAAFQGSTVILELLLALPSPPDLFALSARSELPLSLALVNLHWAVVKLLLSAMKNALDAKALPSERVTREHVQAMLDAGNLAALLEQDAIADKIRELTQRVRALLPSEIVEVSARDYGQLNVPEGFSVLRAFYGNAQHPWDFEHGVEVTESVRAKCDGGGTFVGNPFCSIFGDVRHGIGKSLFAKICKDPAREVAVAGWDDAVHVRKGASWDAVIIPPSTKYELKRAWYGSKAFPWDTSKNKGADVTAKVKALVSGEVGQCRRCADGVILEGGFDGLLGDSAPGVAKNLLIELVKK